MEFIDEKNQGIVRLSTRKQESMSIRFGKFCVKLYDDLVWEVRVMVVGARGSGGQVTGHSMTGEPEPLYS